jgi:hypothetical protein
VREAGGPRTSGRRPGDSRAARRGPQLPPGSRRGPRGARRVRCRREHGGDRRQGRGRRGHCLPALREQGRADRRAAAAVAGRRARRRPGGPRVPRRRRPRAVPARSRRDVRRARQVRAPAARAQRRRPGGAGDPGRGQGAHQSRPGGGHAESRCDARRRDGADLGHARTHRGNRRGRAWHLAAVPGHPPGRADGAGPAQRHPVDVGRAAGGIATARRVSGGARREARRRGARWTARRGPGCGRRNRTA